MKRVVVGVLVLAVLLLAVPSVHADAFQASDVSLDVFSLAYSLSFPLYDPVHTFPVCTGYYIRPMGPGSLFASAGHCGELGAWHYFLPKGQHGSERMNYKISSTYNWPWIDITLGVMPNRLEDGTYPKFAPNPPTVGEKLYGVARTACPGSRPTLKNLIFTYQGIEENSNDVYFYSMGAMTDDTGFCLFGYSGGPVFNHRGEIVGTFVGMFFNESTGETKAAFFIPIAKILKYIQSVTGPADWPFDFGAGNP